MKKSQLNINKEIEALVNKNGTNADKYSESEKAYLLQYSGSGGIKGAKGRGVLHEFYTPQYLADLMVELAKTHGFKGGTVLEPSVATGNLIAKIADKSKITAFELNPITAKICKIRFPEITIYNNYFETAFLEPQRYNSLLKKKLTWLDGYPFDLVIGNPPYGKYVNKYSSYFKSKKFKQIEVFFIYKALELLRSGGLLVYLIGQNFLRTGADSYMKKEISEMADLIDAYRLPPVFAHNKVSTDIIVLRKK